MPVMSLMLLAPVLPFGLPLLNLCMRDRNDTLCQPFESLEWRFRFRRLGRFHVHDIMSKRLPEQAALNKKTPPFVREAPNRFKGLVVRPSYKIRFKQFIQVKLGRFLSLTGEGGNSLSGQLALCCQQLQYASLNLRTI